MYEVINLFDAIIFCGVGKCGVCEEIEGSVCGVESEFENWIEELQ